MNTIENIKNRKCVRAFTSEKIPHKTLTKLIDAAKWTPSSKNTQP